MGWLSNLVQKLNPAQQTIYYEEGSHVGSTASVKYDQAFKKLEAVSRGVGIIVGACSSLDYDIKDKIHEGAYPGIRIKGLKTLLNNRPNPYQSIQEFRTNMFTDFLLEGNVFLYYDGTFLYHLPAVNVEILPDERTFVKGYKYNGITNFGPNEIIHFKDVSVDSIYRGTSRLEAAQRNIDILYKMQDFQATFFDNGAIPGFALATENTLSPIAKERTIQNWMSKYSIKNGARRPIIIDSGLKPVQLFTSTFKDMDFDLSIKSHNVKILETLGVPPVLLDGGNQANISPNLRLFYLETVLPIVRKFVSGIELISGYDVDVVTANVTALQPELKEIASYHATLVNGGIITPNEARLELRYPKDTDPESDKLRVPANIAGSAANPSVGGKPKQPPKEDEGK